MKTFSQFIEEALRKVAKATYRGPIKKIPKVKNEDFSLKPKSKEDLEKRGVNVPYDAMARGKHMWPGRKKRMGMNIDNDPIIVDFKKYNFVKNEDFSLKPKNYQDLRARGVHKPDLSALDRNDPDSDPRAHRSDRSRERAIGVSDSGLSASVRAKHMSDKIGEPYNDYFKQMAKRAKDRYKRELGWKGIKVKEDFSLRPKNPGDLQKRSVHEPSNKAPGKSVGPLGIAVRAGEKNTYTPDGTHLPTMFKDRYKDELKRKGINVGEDFSLKPKSKKDLEKRRVNEPFETPGLRGKDLWPGRKTFLGAHIDRWIVDPFPETTAAKKEMRRKRLKNEDFSLKPKSKEDLAKRDVSHHTPKLMDPYYSRSARRWSPKEALRQFIKHGMDSKNSNLVNRKRASGISSGALGAAVRTTRWANDMKKSPSIRYGRVDYIPQGFKDKYKDILRKKGIKIKEDFSLKPANPTI